MAMTPEEKRAAHREAQRRYAASKKGKQTISDYRARKRAGSDKKSVNTSAPAVPAAPAPAAPAAPAPRAPGRTAEEKRAAHREAQRRYATSQKGRKKINSRRVERLAEKRKLSKDEKSLLKAVRTMGLGKDITVNDIEDFAAYVQYRHSQKVEKNQYEIDEFAQTFKALKDRGLSNDDILEDFRQFKADQEQLTADSALKAGEYAVDVGERLAEAFTKL